MSRRHSIFHFHACERQSRRAAAVACCRVSRSHLKTILATMSARQPSPLLSRRSSASRPARRPSFAPPAFSPASPPIARARSAASYARTQFISPHGPTAAARDVAAESAHIRRRSRPMKTLRALRTAFLFDTLSNSPCKQAFIAERRTSEELSVTLTTLSSSCRSFRVADEHKAITSRRAAGCFIFNMSISRVAERQLQSRRRCQSIQRQRAAIAAPAAIATAAASRRLRDVSHSFSPSTYTCEADSRPFLADDGGFFRALAFSGRDIESPARVAAHTDYADERPADGRHASHGYRQCHTPDMRMPCSRAGHQYARWLDVGSRH